ncbi:hypothetical protein INS90_05805 [Trueperella pecoris]|uniref:Uncharacterized protein n=1 Tax=Trueperella pecoris TaxID=2733571 RepID=A0A7M1QY84_9ACTO|nr:hypothetical protein [Trueperella pecoris]QOR46816.1 hypothetical protein INS90_05805 [Trueperella pecoris]
MHRDYIVFTLLGLLIGLPLLYTAFALVSKNSKGSWDEASRLKGRMRAEGWRVKDTTDNLALFLLGTADLPEFWPISAKAHGIEAVSSARRRPVWRAGTFVAPSVGTHMFFTLEIPQRSDGAEPEFSEALVRVVDGELMYEGAGDVPAFLDDAVRRFLLGWPGLQAAHFLGEKVTFMFDGHREDQVERLKTVDEHAQGIIGLIPEEAWT